MKKLLWIVIVGFLLLVPGAIAQVPAHLTLDTPLVAGPEALLDCTGFDGYQQPLDDANFNSSNTSDQGSTFEVVEAIVDAGGAITTFDGEWTGVRAWGVNVDFVVLAECLGDNTANTPFDITFYADAAGAPGAMVAQTTGAVPTITNTGIPFAFLEIYQYDFAFAPVDATGASWMSISRQAGVADCLWLWTDESLVGTYDDAAYQVGGAPVLAADQAMCMAAAPATPIIEVPTVSPIGLAALLLLLGGGSIFVLRRRRQTS